MGKKLTTEQFIIKSKLIHNDKYDYSLVNYINNRNNIIVICRIHGEFIQKANSHLNGNGCPTCGGVKRPTTGEFISNAIKIHGNKYNYSLVNYVNSKTKVKIICSVHGEFEQTPDSHLKSLCPYCTDRYVKPNEFIKRSQKKHGYKYDYSLVNYINNRIKVKIICPVHGEFYQYPSDHTQGCGCPHCRESKGERVIRDFLITHNIFYISQHKFNDCIDKDKLPFDFYLPKFNMCIEFDGIQHFKPKSLFGGELGFKDRQNKDNIKTAYCDKNNITLLRIRYDENIINKLNNIL